MGFKASPRLQGQGGWQGLTAGAAALRKAVDQLGGAEVEAEVARLRELATALVPEVDTGAPMERSGFASRLLLAAALLGIGVVLGAAVVALI